MSQIPSTPADGHMMVLWVPAIAAPATPDISSELSASVDLSCYLTADGWNPSVDESTTSDDRLCDTTTYENRGRSQRSLSVKYIYNPTATTGTTNLGDETLVEDAVGFFVVRYGLLYSAAVAAAQKVQVWPVRMGIKDYQPLEANSVLRIQQKAFVTGPVVNGALVA